MSKDIPLPKPETFLCTLAQFTVVFVFVVCVRMSICMYVKIRRHQQHTRAYTYTRTQARGATQELRRPHSLVVL